MTTTTEQPSTTQSDTADAPTEPPTPPSARVEISTGEHQVVVEAAESLTRVANTALQIFKATDGPRPRLLAGIGFCGDVGDVTPGGAPPPEVTFPDRWTVDPEEDPPGDPDDE